MEETNDIKEVKELKDLKLRTNIALPTGQSKVYSEVDGLALQNLFYARFEKFPHCFMFTQDSKTIDRFFDTKGFLEWCINNIPEDEEMEHIVYSVYNLDSKEEKIGFCVTLKKSRIYARIEGYVSESYVLYDTDYREELNKFVDALSQFYIDPEPEKNNLYKITSTQFGYKLIKGKVRDVGDFDVTKQYNDDFLEEDVKIKDFLAEDDKGGLIILHGEKGTGKSYYIRHLINEFDEKKFVFVPSNLIGLLGDPSFGSFLETLANHIIILEDCENVIKDRRSGEGSSTAVSLLLNMTDGLLEDDLGIKFICTFNEDLKNIDSALLRRGRLISKYEFKELSPAKANKLLGELYGDKYKTINPMSLADIFNYEKASYEEKKTRII